jgi:hypothetical protein
MRMLRVCLFLVGASLAYVTYPLWAGGLPEAPAEIGEMKRDSLVIGEEALGEIERLHGRGFDLKGGWIAQYSGRGKMKVWFADADTPDGARALVEMMADRIGQGNAAFGHLSRVKGFSGGEVYNVLDKGGLRHYFFAHGSGVVWVEIDSEAPLTVLVELMKAI